MGVLFWHDTLTGGRSSPPAAAQWGDGLRWRLSFWPGISRVLTTWRLRHRHRLDNARQAPFPAHGPAGRNGLSPGLGKHRGCQSAQPVRAELPLRGCPVGGPVLGKGLQPGRTIGACSPGGPQGSAGTRGAAGGTVSAVGLEARTCAGAHLPVTRGSEAPSGRQLPGPAAHGHGQPGARLRPLSCRRLAPRRARPCTAGRGRNAQGSGPMTSLTRARLQFAAVRSAATCPQQQGLFWFLPPHPPLPQLLQQLLHNVRLVPYPH
jgi:hypothetical protein